MQKNIAAYTVPGSNFPEYISINERDGAVVLSARGPGGDPYASTVDVPLPRAELVKLNAEIDKYLAATDKRFGPRVKLREDGFPSRAFLLRGSKAASNICLRDYGGAAGHLGDLPQQ